MSDTVLQEVFLGRQPILDREQQLFAYELLFRSGKAEDGNFASFVDGNQATATVITHAFGVATVLSMNPTIRVIVAPGEYCATEGAMTGAQTLQFLSQFTADYTLLGASGIAADGPSEALIDSGTVYRAMIQRAAKSIVVADHSKFGLTYPYHYAGWSGISRLITDQPLPDHLATLLGREKVVVARGHAAPEQQ